VRLAWIPLAFHKVCQAIADETAQADHFKLTPLQNDSYKRWRKTPLAWGMRKRGVPISNRPKNSRGWIWWLVAVGMLPLSLGMWWFGLVAIVGGSANHPILSWATVCGLMLLLSPFVALSGVIWLVVLMVRADRRQAGRWKVDRNREA